MKRNNPGNIRPSNLFKWKGETTQKGETFCEFSNLKYGCRAMLLLLRNYIEKHKLQTIEQIIARWAPPSENNTSIYISIVAKVLQKDPKEKIQVHKEALINLAQAMTRVEHGKVEAMKIPQIIWKEAYELLP